MASSTRVGKRGNKKIYLKPSETGAQFYQSDASRKSARKPSDDALGKRIDDALDKAMYSDKISPERAGTLKARTFIDRVFDMKKGGRVRGDGCATRGKTRGKMC